MGCRNCRVPSYRVEGNKIICECGYTEEVMWPTYENLKKENERLKEIIKDLEMK